MSPPRLLVLGGTHFVGRAVVDAALADGWQVTALHRGRSPEPLPPAVHQVLGDRVDPTTVVGLARTGDATGADWDLVVDTWSGDPWVVRDAARALSDRAHRYLYVSSRSVYDAPASGSDESWPLVEADPDAGDPTGPDQDAGNHAPVGYAEAKAGGERAVAAAFGDRAVLLRPGVILGPREDVGRLPWWLGRAARGGEMLAPGPRDAAIQVVDARDLAAFALLTVGEEPLSGPYDVTCPAGAVTMGALLDACLHVTGSTARPRWVPPDRVLDAGIAPWTDLPLWLPPGPDHDALHGADVTRALTAGLTRRPLIETVRDTWDWLTSIGGPAPRRADRPSLGLDPELEARLLAGLDRPSAR